MNKIAEFLRKREEKNYLKELEIFKKNFDPEKLVNGMVRVLNKEYREEQREFFVGVFTEEQCEILKKHLEEINQLGAKKQFPVELILEEEGLKEFENGHFYRYKTKAVKYQYVTSRHEMKKRHEE
jgi:hypothetical protein